MAQDDVACGEWPWGDGDAWCAEARAAMRLWAQEHKRELGFSGQRQLEQAAAQCSCTQYCVDRKLAGHEKGWFISAVLRVPCAGENDEGRHSELTLSGSMTKAEDALVGAQFEMSFDPAARGSTGDSAKQLLLCFEAGANRAERLGCGGEAEEDSTRGQVLVERPAFGLEGITAVRIMIDSVAVSRCRDLVIPALDELPDAADFLCSLPLLSPHIGRVVRKMAIEEIVEEVCWQEEEGEDDNDDNDDDDGASSREGSSEGISRASDRNLPEPAAAATGSEGRPLCSADGAPPAGLAGGRQAVARSDDAGPAVLSRKEKRAAKRGRLAASKSASGGDTSSTHLQSSATVASLDIGS